MAEDSAASNSDVTDADSTSVVSVQSNVTGPRLKAKPITTPKTIFSPLESQIVHQQVEGLFGVKPVRPSEAAILTDDNTLYEGFSIGPEYLKDLILNQSNKAKIRPVLLSLRGLPKSGKTEAISHLLERYVDPNSIRPMTPMNEKMERNYHELISFHSEKNLTITGVPKESSCAFGILSALRNEHLKKSKVPLFNLPERSPQCFGDSACELDDHLCRIFQFLYEYEHTPRGNEVTDKEQEYTRRLHKLLPEGIALINIWNIATTKKILHFLSALRGLLYNSHMWIFMDIDRDLENLDKPPETPEVTSNAVCSNEDHSVLMKWRPRLHYLLRFSKMSESIHGSRKDVCTVFAKRKSTSNEDFKHKVLEAKVQQAAKQIGVSSLVEPKIETINFDSSGICDESSLCLYEKMQFAIYHTRFQDVPLSWLFLRSLFYNSQEIFVEKSELSKKAKECGMNDDSLTKFCEFYTSFGSIFDLSLVDPDYPYVIVKPMGFLNSLENFFSPEERIRQQCPTLVNGIIPEKACQVFGENWSKFIEALVSVNLATKVSSSKLDIDDLDPNDTYYFIPLSRNGSPIMEADPTAVHIIINVDTPHVFQQATFAKYLLGSLQEPKLIPCSNPNKTIIKECSTNTTIALVSHSPATKISISQVNFNVCSHIIKAYSKIAETCKLGTTKYKFVMICAKSGVPDVRDIPSCQYHVLPNNKLCTVCEIAGRVNDQLQMWNKALRKDPIPEDYMPDEKLKESEPKWITKKFGSYASAIIPYLAEALELDSTPSSDVNAMISLWNKKLVKSSGTENVEPRRMLARKLIEMSAKFCSSLDISCKVEAESLFESIAKDLDVHAPTIKQLEVNIPLTEQDEITRDVYEKYSQEDGVIPFKAVKWIFIGPPQVGKTTTKMRLLEQIYNIKSEGGIIKPDSTGIEKPVEVISAAMISDNDAKNSLYWKALNESQLDKALMCYINSQSISSKRHSVVLFRNRTHPSESVDDLLKSANRNEHSLEAGDCSTSFNKDSPIHLLAASENDENDDFSESSNDSTSHSLISSYTFDERINTDLVFSDSLQILENKQSENTFTISSDAESQTEILEVSSLMDLMKKKQHSPKQLSLVLDFIKTQCSDEAFFQFAKEIKDSISGSTCIYITDTGGQPEFLRLLPVILSKPAFYFVFFSLFQQLDKAYTVNLTKDGKTHALYQSTHTVKDILSQLLFSLHIPTDGGKYSKIKSRALLFGTNADRPYKAIDKINNELKTVLPSNLSDVTSVESNFSTVFIPVDNMNGSEVEISKIRQYLEKLVKEIEPVKVPVSWLIFHILLRKRFKNSKVCSLNDCQQLASECSIAKDHVKAVLTFIHQNLGTILYYGKVDENVIICVPDVLLNIISELVVVSVGEGKSTEANTYGIIHEDFLESLMSDKEVYGDLDAQYVIKVMKHFQLVAMLSEKDEISSDSVFTNSAPLFFPGVLRPDPDYNNNLVSTDHNIHTTLLISFGEKIEMPPHLFQNLIVTLRAQSVEMEKKEPQLMWSLSHDHSRYNDHIYFKVSYCKEEWFVELQLRKIMTEYIEVRCKPIEDVSTQSIQQYWNIVYHNIKKVLNIVCDTFPHTRHLKPMYGAYCWSGNDLHFSKYNEEKSTFLCNNCDWDKKEATVWFQPFKEMDKVTIKDELPFEQMTTDVGVQFDCFFPLIDSLQNAYIAGQKLFVFQGDHSQSFNWNECGLKLSCPQGALSSLDERCEVAIVALAGGQFNLPERTKLVSAIYAISVSKTLLKPLTLELQHCVALETKAQTDCLFFVRAPHVGCDLNAEFTIMEGGTFYPGSWYGSITRCHFCKVGVVQKETSVKQFTATTDVNVVANSVTDIDRAAERLAYFCKVYYEKIAPLEWSVKLSIVRRLNALEEYMKRQRPKADAADYFDKVLPSGKCFKFDLNIDAQKPPLGWSIYQLTTNPEFEYEFINKFASDELPEPPSCSLRVYAKDSPDTEGIFHYLVPLKGVNNPEKITIHLSLRSSPVAESISMTSNLTNQSSTPLSPVVTRRALVRCTDLLVESSMDPFTLARKLYSKEIISEDVYKRVRDRETRDPMERIFDHLKDRIDHDVSIFTEFLSVLRDLSRNDLADIIMAEYFRITTEM